MKIAYADPPYIGCAHLYRDHPDYAGEVDHVRLIERLERDYDGWILHAAATPRSIATLAPLVERTGARWMAWVKGFAAFKRNIPVAFAWEPVIVKAARKPVVSKRLVMRDWIQESITLRVASLARSPKRSVIGRSRWSPRVPKTRSTTCFLAAARSRKRGAHGVSNSLCRTSRRRGSLRPSVCRIRQRMEQDHEGRRGRKGRRSGVLCNRDSGNWPIRRRLALRCRLIALLW